MKRLFLLLLYMVAINTVSTAQSNYYVKKAQSYQREAEYYQKKAEGYLRTISRKRKVTSAMLHLTQSEVILIVQRHTLVMLRMRWINTKHNCVMRLRQITERQCI